MMPILECNNSCSARHSKYPTLTASVATVHLLRARKGFQIGNATSASTQRDKELPNRCIGVEQNLLIPFKYKECKLTRCF